jgi:hypothetical protein
MILEGRREITRDRDKKADRHAATSLRIAMLLRGVTSRATCGSRRYKGLGTLTGACNDI